MLNIKKSLLFIMISLIYTKTAAAQGFFQDIYLDSVNFYTNNFVFVDFVIFFLIFYALITPVARKIFEGPSGQLIGFIVPITLAFSIAIWESERSESILELAAPGIIAALAFLSIFGLLKLLKYKFNRKTIILSTFLLLMFIIIFGHKFGIQIEEETRSLLFIISSLIFFIIVLALIGKLFTKET